MQYFKSIQHENLVFKNQHWLANTSYPYQSAKWRCKHENFWTSNVLEFELSKTSSYPTIIRNVFKFQKTNLESAFSDGNQWVGIAHQSDDLDPTWLCDVTTLANDENPVVIHENPTSPTFRVCSDVRIQPSLLSRHLLGCRVASWMPSWLQPLKVEVAGQSKNSINNYENP